MELFLLKIWIFLFLLAPVPALKIGIIGGGIGGTTAAYFIRQIFEKDADIHLFEKSRIGGRLDLVEINNRRFESGGSIIHTKNEYMMRLIDQFGLSRRPASDGTFGLYDGDQMVFTSSSWPLVTPIKLFWRYGYDVIKLERLIDAMMLKFARIYQLLDSGAAYDTVEDLLLAMDPSLVKLPGLPLAQYLKLSGLRELFIDELASAAARTNYGQGVMGLHAFVGMVALAGAGADLTSVSGGNYQVAVKALEASGAALHHEQVQTVRFTDDTYLLTSVDGAGAAQTRSFDIVVVATPQTADHATVAWEGMPAPLAFPGRYHNLSVTFVEGQLRPSAFGAAALPDDILGTQRCRTFNSIGTNTPVAPPSAEGATGDKEGATVHKVFSTEPLSEAQLNELFESRQAERRLWWLAYPQYSVPTTLGNFTLRPHLYYLSSVEQAASAMEMSVIAARNIANMAFTRWYNRAPPDLSRVLHTEL